jgi:probable rRNA maturation factor
MNWSYLLHFLSLAINITFLQPESISAWKFSNMLGRIRIAACLRNRITPTNPQQRLVVVPLPWQRTRLFGSKSIPGNPPGKIEVCDNQEVDVLKVDLDRLRQTVAKIRKIIGYDTYDISLFLVSDQEMQQTNDETRGMDEPTDILSFPFHPHVKPGVLQEPSFDIPDYYALGDILIDVPYVVRSCLEDQEYETDEEERGVSGAMQSVYDPEERINMLLVHGILHLVGYDHEEDDEYEQMVAKEEEILKQLGMLTEKKSA